MLTHYVLLMPQRMPPSGGRPDQNGSIGKSYSEWELSGEGDAERQDGGCQAARGGLDPLLAGQEYLRTGDARHALVGNGPYWVDKEDGILHQIAVVNAVAGAWESACLTRVKGSHQGVTPVGT
ncbi:hypothetical protein [Streptomyces sp. NPDC050564]|uniref:hypothetical protein n=1 Tax=Streptomyces sp. NPDC050564 TaxID=3365631 RepID=UPI0037928D7B